MAELPEFREPIVHGGRVSLNDVNASVVEQLDDQIDGETDNATALHIKQKHMAKTEAHSDLEFLGFS